MPNPVDDSRIGSKVAGAVIIDMDEARAVRDQAYARKITQTAASGGFIGLWFLLAFVCFIVWMRMR